MRRSLSILLLICLTIRATAQQPEMDRELCSLVSAVKTLRNAGVKTFNKVRDNLSASELWTPMDETGPFRDSVECHPSEKFPRFRLNAILNDVARKRTPVRALTESMLSGTDLRYNYSLYERSIRGGCQTSFTLENRWGHQWFVIIPYSGFGSISASLSIDGGSPRSFTEEADGSLTLYTPEPVNEGQILTLTVSGLKTCSYVIINHNTRDKSGPLPKEEVEFRAKMRSLVKKGTEYYYLSDRQGIMATVDSLRFNLNIRSTEGLLSRPDSLEFTAHLFRLIANYNYESENASSILYLLAEQYLKKALDIFNSPEFKDDADLFRRPIICRELAQLYYKLERYKEALDYTVLAEQAYRNSYLNQSFKEGSDDWAQWQAVRMQKAMCLARLGRFDDATRLSDSVLVDSGTSDKEALYAIKRMKGKILILQGDAAKAREAATLYRDYLRWRKADAINTLAALPAASRQGYWMRTRPFVADAYLLEARDPGLLYDVALFSKNLLLQMNLMKDDSSVKQYLGTSWTDIKKALPDNAAAIEFIEYKGSMAALVLKKSGSPVWVKIPSTREIMTYKIKGSFLESRLLSTDGKVKNALYQDAGLKEMLWNGELCKELEGCNAVYFAPDGYLHQLALEYLMPDKLSALKIYRLSSTRQLLKPRKVTTGTALIIGGVDYDSSLPQEEAANNDSLAYYYMRSQGISFGPLEGTLEEATAISDIRSNPKDFLYTGPAATEQVFRIMAGRFPMISISTHGYFRAAGADVGTDVKVCMSDDALSESILALSGANYSLEQEAFNPDCMDGLLSAAEISRMDLSRVDLAVISACQTALGYVTSDGVYGIQRGFKNAGAGCLVLSLWSVDDAATTMLMTAFQKNLLQGQTVHTAFENARSSLAENHIRRELVYNTARMAYVFADVEENYAQPEYSNAFILIDVTK